MAAFRHFIKLWSTLGSWHSSSTKTREFFTVIKLTVAMAIGLYQLKNMCKKKVFFRWSILILFFVVVFFHMHLIVQVEQRHHFINYYKAYMTVLFL